MTAPVHWSGPVWCLSECPDTRTHAHSHALARRSEGVCVSRNELLRASKCSSREDMFWKCCLAVAYFSAPSFRNLRQVDSVVEEGTHSERTMVNAGLMKL